MSKLSLSNIIRVTVQSALKGLANANTSALALITDNAPIPTDYGTFRTYLEPTGVATDFGSNSDSARIANLVFAQNPNILTGGGFLQIIPRLQSAPASKATIVSSSFVDLTVLTATDYTINLDIDGAGAGDQSIGTIDTTSIETVESSINSALTGAGVSISGELNQAKITLVSATTGATSSLVVGNLAGAGTNLATLLGLSGNAIGYDAGVESIKDCILRTNGLVDYFGIIYDTVLTDQEIDDTSVLVQAIDKIQFIGDNTSAQITDKFKAVKDAGLTQTRCLYYGSTDVNDAVDFSAGYASRALSVNFDASNTATTMHLKEVIGITPDTTLTQTLLDSAKANGVDVYADFGVSKLFTSGANKFFDEVYILLAIKLRFQIAGFNALATTNTKIPQTENGMNSLKKAYREVCETFVTNGAIAPGAWNSSTTFGSNPDDHIRNIQDFGYFIYSAPISQQAQNIREQRIAPVVQIALKGAGAIHSSDVIVQYEA